MTLVAALVLAQAWLEAPELKQVRAAVAQIDGALDASVPERFFARTRLDPSLCGLTEQLEIEHHTIASDAGTWERWRLVATTEHGCAEASGGGDVTQQTLWLRDRRPLFVLRSTSAGDMTRLEGEARWWFGASGAPLWWASWLRGSTSEGQQINRRETGGAVSGFDAGVSVPPVVAPCDELGVFGTGAAVVRAQEAWCSLTGKPVPSRALPRFTLDPPIPLRGEPVPEEVWKKVQRRVLPFEVPEPSDTPAVVRRVLAPGVELDLALDEFENGAEVRAAGARRVVWAIRHRQGREARPLGTVFELSVGPWGTVERTWHGKLVLERWQRPGRPTTYRVNEGQLTPDAPRVSDVVDLAKRWR